MKKKSIIFVVLVSAIAAFNIMKSQTGMIGLFDVTLQDVEAIAGCESADGYDMNRYCLPGNGRCYYADFIARNCISNRV